MLHLRVVTQAEVESRNTSGCVAQRAALEETSA